MPLKLDELSIDILLLIFQYCDIYDLCKLKETCTLFNKLIHTSLHIIRKNDSLVTNQAKPILKQRTLNLLTAYEKWRISHNWKIGRYVEKSYLYERERFMPWLNLTKDHVWLSRGKYIKAYKRRKFGIDVRKPEYVLSSSSNSDICKFIYKDNYIVAGHSDGSFWLWSFEKRSFVFNIDKYHLADVNCTDLNGEIIVTGSKDERVIIWSCSLDNTDITLKYTLQLNDRVLSLNLCRECKLLAVGTSGYEFSPLDIYDVEKCKLVYQLGTNFRKGSGVLDMKWDNPQCLYTCGYDMHIRRWDTRVGNLVQSWDDPFSATVYCLDTDNCYTLISGTSTYGRAVLWDTRMKKCVQLYFMNTCKRGRSSPIYSLSFDSSHLITATDLYLNLLDFSIKNSQIRNYNIKYCKEIIAYS